MHVTRLVLFAAHLVCGLFLAHAGAQVPSAPTNLLVEWLPSPALGIDVRAPRFSFTPNVGPSVRGAVQRRYQIVVFEGSTGAFIAWDSGPVQSSNCAEIVYKGTALKSDTTYSWKARWWTDNLDPSGWSTTAMFHTGLFSEAEWGAEWLTGYNSFRKDFVVPATINEAYLFITGLGWFNAFINGQRVDPSRFLDPSVSHFEERIFYVTFDVSHLLKPNTTNLIGIELGHGWWNQVCCNPGPLTIARLSMTDKTGAKSYVLTDETWEGFNGGTTQNSLYDGQIFDGRSDVSHWAVPGKLPYIMATPIITSPPTRNIRAMRIPPIRALEVFKPKTMTGGPRSYLYDFEQNFSGVCTILPVSGPRGQEITLVHGEYTINNSTVGTANLRTATQTDVFRLDGTTKDMSYTPRLTYHGFRFVQLNNYPGTPSLSSIVCHHFHTDVPRTGKFSWNIPIFDRLQKNILYTQQSNMMSIPTDCPQRDERQGWTADAHLTSDEAIHNFFMPAFYENWMELMTDDQFNGALCEIIPCWPGIGRRPGDPAWTAAYYIIHYNLYKYYGATRYLEAHYNVMKSNIAFFQEYLKDNGGLSAMFYFYSDWIPPPPAQPAGGAFIGSWFYLYSVRLTAYFARELGYTKDAQYYQEYYEDLTDQFNVAFFSFIWSSYDSGVQSTYALPIWLGIVPTALQTTVRQKLLADIDANGHHLTTGILGTKYLIDTLGDRMNRVDAAVSLIFQSTYPSWLYEIVQTVEASATTIWELWNGNTAGPGMNSRNHPAFGAVGWLFYKFVAGIQNGDSLIETTSLAYEKVTIKPLSNRELLLGRIDHISAIVRTLSGDIAVEWVVAGGSKCGLIASPQWETPLDCRARGGTIESVAWTTSCGNYPEFIVQTIPESCTQLVQQQCIGKPSCSIKLSGLKCEADLQETKQSLPLYLSAQCNVQPQLSLDATIPVSSAGLVTIWNLGQANLVVKESNKIVWSNNKFVASASEGVESAVAGPDGVIFKVKPGSYSFVTSNANATTIQSATLASGMVSLSCNNNHTIGVVQDVSVQCGSEAAATSFYALDKVESSCLGKSSCKVAFSLIDYPCWDEKNTLNQLYVRYICM